MNFQEYDIVSLTEDLSSTLLRGTKGVVMLILDKTQTHYEVEFIDNEKETIEFATVGSDQIRLVERPEENGRR